MNQKELDKHYMQRALSLAEKGRLGVKSNPMVGCVIVKDNTIIGEGWHRNYGEGHAEVNAVNSVKEKDSIRGSTIYVTLEPCSHYGKTPPCAELIKSVAPKRLVVCNLDPNPKVAGRGIALLKDAGIAIETAVLEEEGLKLNRIFFHFIQTKRPYVILKWAESLDGFIAAEKGKRIKITNALAHTHVHQQRASISSIMVGSATVKNDNPKLTNREWIGGSPLRIVIDRCLNLANTYQLFDEQQATLIYHQTAQNLMDKENITFQSLEKEDFLSKLLDDLGARGINSLYVEGGSTLHQLFVKAELYQEIHRYRGNCTLKKGVSAVQLPQSLLLTKTIALGDSTFEQYLNH